MQTMVEVTQEDANNYCEVLRALGMEEEGDPVVEVDHLLADSLRLEWLMRNVSGAEFRRIGVEYGGNCGRDRIDAAMNKVPNVAIEGLRSGRG